MNTTKSKSQKATETHSADSLAERIGTTVEAIEELLEVGALNPVSSNESGDRLVFESEDLDALRAAIQAQVEDEVNEATEGQPARKREFAVARAKVLLEMQARESASNYRREIRLAAIREAHEIRFGIGGEVLGTVSKWASRFLKRPGATLAIGGKAIQQTPGLLPAMGRNAVATGAAGSILGGAKAALDGDEETGILGGAARGGAIGAGVGAAGTLAGRAAIEAMLKKRRLAGMSAPARLGNSPGFQPV